MRQKKVRCCFRTVQTPDSLISKRGESRKLWIKSMRSELNSSEFWNGEVNMSQLQQQLNVHFVDVLQTENALVICIPGPADTSDLRTCTHQIARVSSYHYVPTSHISMEVRQRSSFLQYDWLECEGSIRKVKKKMSTDFVINLNQISTNFDKEDTSFGILKQTENSIIH